MKVRTKFMLVTFLILGVGTLLSVAWLQYSSGLSAVHQAVEANLVLSESVSEAAREIMRSGEQEYLDAYLTVARKFPSVNGLRVIRSEALESELGIKENSRAHDDLDRQVLVSGQRIIRTVTLGQERAIRIISPVLADKSCLACHAKIKEGSVIAALSTTLSFQKTLDEIRLNLVKNSIIQGLIILIALWVVFVFFSKRVMDPVRKVGDAARRFGQGDWSALVELDPKSGKVDSKGKSPGTSSDEIADLSFAFNEMARDLSNLTVARDLLALEMKERKKIEASLRESNLRFDQLAEQSGTFAWEIDAQGLYTYVSHVIETVLGYHPNEVVGLLHFYDLHPEEGREEFKKATFDALGRKEEFLDFVNPLRAKSGRIVQISTSAIPLMDNNGILLGYRGADTDITERLAMEADQRKSAKEFEVFYKASVGREERILQLKKEVEQLRKELEK